MKTMTNHAFTTIVRVWICLLLAVLPLHAQSLLNVDFGAGGVSPKVGPAGTGLATNDFWNMYSHYTPKFAPGMSLVPSGELRGLKYADGTASEVGVAVANAPGVWGNPTGDPMYDSYIYAQNGSNIVVQVRNLPAGRYHFYLYGHAEPDGSAEQNSSFTLKHGTNILGPLAAASSAGWRATQPMQERQQYVVFRDVEITGPGPVRLEVAPSPGGAAVLNGLQIISRGTSPPHTTAAALAKSDFQPIFLCREVRYEGRLTNDEARFQVSLEVETRATNEISLPLFEGDVAVLAPELPEGFRLVAGANSAYRLCAATSGVFRLNLTVLAKITKAEPWNQIAFTGPPAAIASLKAEATAAGAELQMLSGTPLGESQKPGSKVEGLPGADAAVKLRWQSKSAEVTRKSLITVDTAATAQITPTVVKFTTALRYEILQAPLPRLQVELPAGQTLIRLEGGQIRDWQVKTEAGRQVLTVEFIKPVEKALELTLASEQAVDSAATSIQLTPPAPLEVQRESGAFSLSTDDMQAEPETLTGLRQVNAAAGAVAAYRFFERPASLTARIKRIEPLIRSADRVTARLEDTRLLITHGLLISVEKAGIYHCDLFPQTNLTVADVKGDGVEDWKLTEGRLLVNFTSRLLGARKLEVTLEQPLKVFPKEFSVLPLRVAGATNETAQIGAGAAMGIQLKTSSDLAGLREIPTATLPGASDEMLAFQSEQADWRLAIAAEKLSARVVAEVFNLVTIGDGIVGGSATVRFGLVNQGVQEFKLLLPAHWKNIEFTGPNIRRKEMSAGPDTNTTVWTITLQDKAWGGYTLVATYDYQFDAKEAVLNFAGLHARAVERESGSLAITVAGNFKVEIRAPAEPLREIDPSELSETDRALITRPVYKAYRYTGSQYALAAALRRHQEVRVLDAVTDRTQITTVVTEQGELLTQAAFMVKNNDRQFQKFALPPGAEFWAAYVNNEPVKAERDNEWLLVALPRGANRDEAFAIDLVYAQQLGTLQQHLPKTVQLEAPRSDVPNTYAEWQVYLPNSEKAFGYGGTMTVTRGTVYRWADAWQKFAAFYRENAGVILGLSGLLLLAGFIVSAIRASGIRALLRVFVVLGILGLLFAIAIPNFVKARTTAQRNSSINNLRQLDGAIEQWALENKKAAGADAPQLNDLVGTDKYIKIAPEGINYVAPGKKLGSPNAILAYTELEGNTRSVLFAGKGIQTLTEEAFQVALQQESAGDWGAQVQANFQLAQRPGQPAAQRAAGATPQFAAGVRPIRIELPRDKTSWILCYTKVLNLTKDPLKIEMKLMPLRVYSGWRTFFQLAVFGGGLILIWRQLRRAERSALAFALGTLLTIGGAANTLITWRALHLGLIPLPLIALLALFIWLGRRFWKRRQASGTTPPLISPEITALAALLLLPALTTHAQAGEEMLSSTALLRSSNLVSLVAAEYQGAVREKVAQFDVTLQLQSVASNQVLRLFGEEIAIQEFKAGEGISLVRAGGGTALRLAAPGKATVQLKLAAKLGGEVTRRALSFSIPAALASRMTLAIDEPDAEVEFPGAVALQRTTDAKETRLQAVLGAGGRAELFWTPRVKRATEVAATIFAQSTSVVALGGGVANTRTKISYQVAQGELRQAKVRLPAGQRLLRVEGEWIRTWDLTNDASAQILTVELVKAVSPAWQLAVETERVLEKLPAQVTAEPARPLDVLRASGSIGVTGAEELSLAVETARDVQRLDAGEFAKEAGLKDAQVIAAYRYLRPDFQLAVRAEAVQPQVEAQALNTARIGFEQVALSAQLDYTIKKSGIFKVRALLPAGFRVESVAGENIQQWDENPETHVLSVALKTRSLGAYQLRANLVRRHRELPKTLEIPAVLPLDTEKLTAFTAVGAEAGITLKTAAIEGLTEIPASALPGTMSRSAGTLAYKFISTARHEAVPWKLGVATEIMESWVRAEVVNLLSVSETLVSGRALVRLEIANAPVKEFTLRIPAAYTNVEITGTDIRRRDQTGEVWRVELQNKTRGYYLATVTWEQPRPARSNLLETLGIEVIGAERENGAVVLLARPPLSVTERSATGQLVRIDARELPEWAGISANPGPGGERPVLVHRYLRPGWRLGAEIRRFEEAAVLTALVDSARLTTVVADDGQMMTEMRLEIRNNGRQHLEILLPAKAEIWSAFVAGQPVRPTLREGRLLLPLERSVDEAPVSVEVVYVSQDTFPRRQGTVSLESPQLDLPLKNARWEVYLPPQYDCSHYAGSMTHDATAAPVVQVFSQNEYLQQEAIKKTAQRSMVINNLRNLKQSLDNNKLGNNESYNFFRNNGEVAQDAATAQEFKALEKDFKRRQSSNLIQSQNAYAWANSARLGDAQVQQRIMTNALINAPVQQAAQMDQGGGNNYDQEVAEQQWERLEKAQQVKVARVQPLRANLPTRGQRHLFTQILQTKENKPLTISFTAANTLEPNWPLRILATGAAFLALWIAFAAGMARRNETNNA